MVELDIAFATAAFVAGVLMFLAPCTLPLVPAYLAFISGLTPNDLRDPATATAARRSILINGLLFCIGFSVIFIVFGLLAGMFGAYVGQFRAILSQVGGAFIIVFGLMMLNIVRFTPLLRERRLRVPRIFTPGNPLSAFVIGSTFALGWTPCVGPVLASVLLLASTSATIWSGGLLLTIFSLGLSVPFIVTAVLYARATKVINSVTRISKWISWIGGLFLILIGLLLLTENFGLMLEYGYRIFYFIGFEALFNYL